jgi:hypothetical protein
MENSIEREVPNEEVRLGIYKHFKGNEYEVENIATDSETQEPIVVYKALYGENKLWVRPAKMFLEEVTKPELGYKGPRFTYVKEK